MPADEAAGAGAALVACYNRGCGQKFNPRHNDQDDACRHHPGLPFFHDAYKGWSCCNRKCIDFTEFLNIQGCTLSKHSDVKPLEPVKQETDRSLEKEVIEVRMPAPIGPSGLERPPFDSPFTEIKPEISETLALQVQQTSSKVLVAEDSGVIAIGTACKNGGCSTSYEGPSSDETTCTYHPGCPVFHEGLKFWTCCQKRTTDFNTFLSQPGCTTGAHKWRKEVQKTGTVKCRWDWHQTPEYVIVSIYAKQYHPTKSYVKLNPIRLNTKMIFPQEGDASFELDIELRGIVNIDRSSATMTPSKLEIKLKKQEPGSWTKLDFPRSEVKKEEPARTPAAPAPQPEEPEDDDLEDLSSVQALESIGKVNIREILDPQ